MEIRIFNTRLAIVRNYPRGYGIEGNLGFGAVNRVDRKALGITFTEVSVGPYRLEAYRCNRHFVDRVVTVGERGAW